MFVHITIDQALAFENVFGLKNIWECMSKSKHLRYSHLIEYPDKPWRWRLVSGNVNGLGVYQDEYLDRVKQIIAARKIQRYWRRAINCPQYALCRKRLFVLFEL